MKDFKLDHYRKIATGFTTPDGYFEQVSNKIMEDISFQESKLIEMKPSKKSWIFAAAAVLVLCLTIPVINFINPTVPEVPADAIETYLAYSNISEEDLIDHLTLEDIEDLTVDTAIDENGIEAELLSRTDLEHLITL